MEGITEGDEDKILNKSDSVSVSYWIPLDRKVGFWWQRKVPEPLMLMYVKWGSSGVPSAAPLLDITVLCWCPALPIGQVAQGGKRWSPDPGVNPGFCLWCWRNPAPLHLVRWCIPAVVFESWSQGQAGHYKEQYFPWVPLWWCDLKLALTCPSISLFGWLDLCYQVILRSLHKKTNQPINCNIDGPNASVWGRAVLEISQHGLEVGQSGKH